MERARRRWEGRRFSDAERFLAYQGILEGRTYADIAAELNCSLQFLYRQFGTQKERARRTGRRSPLRLSPAEREEISRALVEAKGFKSKAAKLLGISRPTLDKKIRLYGLNHLLQGVAREAVGENQSD